jgi:minor histocompatibility antigen H13
MTSPGPVLETLGRVAYEFSLIQPYLPTYLHLLISALFPIYAGAHASLSRPSSAARSSKRKKVTDGEEEESSLEDGRRMEGLSPSDAILYPLLTGSMLAGLYFLIKWLQDPAILNKILNWYLSVFGILSITMLLSDSISTVTSYIFPARYSNGGFIWEVNRTTKFTSVKTKQGADHRADLKRSSPLPGILSQLPLPDWFTRYIWSLRDGLTQPIAVLETYIRGVVETKLKFNLPGLFSIIFAVTAVLYFNLIGKPWWLTNLLGFSFSYSALQLMSPTTFATGTLVLTSLFFYDIYFVFFTPLMITVATKLDIPVKLLFPRPSGPDDDPTKQALSMLGLGDIVLPGIMIGLALRFDLYLYYLRKQTKQKVHKDELLADKKPNDDAINTENEASVNVVNDDHIIKSPYVRATGGWGERFWLGHKYCADKEGGSFPKVYFYSSILGYIIGMLCTIGVMHVFHHGQPALLYLVPGVLGSLWGTALIKGDINVMWEYTEAEEDRKENQKQADAKVKESDTAANLNVTSQDKDDKDEVNNSAKASTSATIAKTPGRRLITISLNLAKEIPAELASQSENPKRALQDHASSEDWVDLKLNSTPRSSSSTRNVTPIRQVPDIDDSEPAEKRRRLE